MRVLVVDDHEGFRSALVAAIGLVDGLEVAGDAPDGESAFRAAMALSPDVVLMDLSMPGISGIEATRKIHQRMPGLPVVILTAHADAAVEAEARAAGAAGFLAKGAPFEEVVEALKGAVVASGRRPHARAAGA